jgi:hypothetical protein
LTFVVKLVWLGDSDFFFGGFRITGSHVLLSLMIEGSRSGRMGSRFESPDPGLFHLRMNQGN